MRKLALLGFMVGMFGVISVAVAADKDDPSGTWKWKTKFGKGDNAKEIERTMKLDYKDGKLTGTVSGFGKGGETKIEDATFDKAKGTIKFNTTRVGGKDKDQKFTTKYEGKLDGDAIKGSITTEFGGKENKQDWEPKREKKKD